MTSSSGIKRGLASSAVAALAVTGLPFLAGTAHAAPFNSQVADSDTVVLVSLLDTSNVTTKNDGQNTTYRLEALGGADIQQVRFEYSLNAGTTRTPIATVSRNDNGAFMTEWAAEGLAGAPVTIYAVGINAAGSDIAPAATDPVASDADSVDSANGTVNNAADSVNITNGEQVGVFQQPYASDGHTGNEVIVSGTASSADPITLGYFDGTTETESGSATPNASGVWRGVLDITGYPFGANDQLLVTADNGESDDTEAYALYKQTITTVTAAADRSNVPAGGAATVTVKVVDQNGNPISGAQVFSSNGDGPEYTDENGEAEFAQNAGSGNNAYYYANATDSNDYEPELGDKKSETVAVTQYNPTPTTLDAESKNGNAFDVDEYDANDITVQVEDQQGNDFDTTGQTLNYYWVFTPFAGGPSVTDNPKRTQPVEINGEYQVLPPDNGFAGDGTYELFGSLSSNAGGNGAIAESKLLTVKSGDSDIVFDESSPEQGVIGESEVVSGRLELADGTGLPGRPILLTANGPGNAQFDQDGGAADANTYSTVTDANGDFSGTLDDPNADTTREDNSVTAETTAGGPDNDADHAMESATQDVDFEKSVAPATVEITDNGTNEDGESAGEVQDFQVTVRSADDPATAGTDESAPLANQEVTLTVSNGYFTNGNPQGSVGDDAGVYDNDGQTKTYTTNGNGQVVVKVSIGRDEGFDDDGDVTATLSATAGTASDTDDVVWTSENPLNPGEVTVEFADEDDQDSTVLPKARVGQRVELIVKAFDQFGNRVGNEWVDLEDNTNDAWLWNGGATTDYDEEWDDYARADEETDQKITATWTNSTEVLVADGADAGTAPDEANGPDESVTDQITINWYEIDYAGSTYTLDDNTGGEAEVGETVTMTVTAVDQEGQPIRGATVEFVRSGPGAQDGDVNYVTSTDASGKATYNFKGTEAGTADITAVVRDGNDGSQLATLSDSVTFGEAPPDGRLPITVKLTSPGKNGGKPDVLNVKTRKLAEGAVVKIFRQNKKTGETRRPAFDQSVLDSEGRASFVAPDLNGKRATKYIVKVFKTARTKAGWSNIKGVR